MATKKIEIQVYPHPMESGFIAHWGEFDLDDPTGNGKTEWEAIQDLIENSRPYDYEIGEQ